jgi:hypothetical protein
MGDMGGHGGHPIEEGAKGIVWLQHCQTMVQVEDFFVMVSLYHGSGSQKYTLYID